MKFNSNRSKLVHTLIFIPILCMLVSCSDVISTAIQETPFHSPVEWYTFAGGTGDDTFLDSAIVPGDGIVVCSRNESAVPSVQGITPVYNRSGYEYESLLVRYRDNGSVKWCTFAGPQSSTMPASILEYCSNGNLVMAANVDESCGSIQSISPLRPYSGSNDIMISCYSDDGTLLWYTFAGSPFNDYCTHLLSFDDGGFILGCEMEDADPIGGISPLNAHNGRRDMCLVRFDGSGNMLWYTFLGDQYHNQLVSLVHDNTGGFIAAGTVESDPGSIQGMNPVNPYTAGTDILLARFDSNGQLSWYTFTGSSGTDSPTELHITNNNIILSATAGEATTLQGVSPIHPYNGGSSDIMLVTLSLDGDVLNYNYFGGAGTDFASDSDIIPGEGIVLVSTSSSNIFSLHGQLPLNSYSGSSDFMVIRTSPGLELQWYTFLGGNRTDIVSRVSVTDTGNIICGGVTLGNIDALESIAPLNPFMDAKDILLVSLHSSGHVNWFTMLGGPGTDNFGDFRKAGEGRFYITGESYSPITELCFSTPLQEHSGNIDLFLSKLYPSNNNQ